MAPIKNVTVTPLENFGGKRKKEKRIKDLTMNVHLKIGN